MAAAGPGAVDADAAPQRRSAGSRRVRWCGALLLIGAAAVFAKLHVGRGAADPWSYKGFVGLACVCLGLALLLIPLPRRWPPALPTRTGDATYAQVMRALLAVVFVLVWALNWHRLQLDNFGAQAALLAVAAVVLLLLLPQSPRGALPMSLRLRQLFAVAAVSLFGVALFLEQEGLLPYLIDSEAELWSRLFAVVVPPVAEELLFRGSLWAACRRFLPVWITVLVTAALFTVAHQWLVYSGHRVTYVYAIAGAGLLLGLLRARTGSLAPCMLAHALMNGLPALLAELLER